jgi:putative mRNA 3-end processing factor
MVTHGQVGTMVRWLAQNGYDAGAFSTEYGEEDDEASLAKPEQTTTGEKAASDA